MGPDMCLDTFMQVGVFQMEEAGLMPVADPSSLFVRDRSLAPGVSSAVTVMMEGTRPMMVEVQALCSPLHNQVGPPFHAAAIPDAYEQ